MAIRISNTIRAELDVPIDNVIFWTDSLTVLQYINNRTRRFHRFVATRLEEIHEHTTPDQCNHVPGVLNPADDGSRGLPIQAFQPRCRWWSGPEFLRDSQEHWPHRDVGDVAEDDKEAITLKVSQNTLTVATGSYTWLIRIVDFVKSKRSVPPTVNHSKIGLAETLAASKAIVKTVQQQYFQEDLEALESGKPIKKDSELSKLCPVLIDGTICVGGRPHHAPVVSQAMHPLVIPSQHPIALLLIRHHHEILGHAGREQVLSVLRQKFCILNARALTRRILRNCIACRKRNERVMTQMMGDLPKPSLTPHEPPFTYTGMDFFGPFYVKRGRGT